MLKIAVVSSAPAPQAGPVADGPAAARLMALGAGFVLAAWDAEAVPGQRLMPAVDGVRVPLPYTSLSLPLSRGRQRSLAILQAPPGFDHVSFRAAAGGTEVAHGRAETLAAWDSGALLAELAPRHRLRLARLLLEFGSGVAALRTSTSFVAACRSLVLALAPSPSWLRPRLAPAPGLAYVQGSLSPGFGEATRAILIGPSGIAAAPFAPLLSGSADRSGRRPIGLLLEAARCEPGTLAVLLGPGGLATRRLDPLPPGIPTPRQLDAPLPPALRDYLTFCLADRGRTDPAAAEAARELQIIRPLPVRQLTDPRQPLGASIDLAVPTGDGGLFAAGWLHDPHGMVAALEFRSACGGDWQAGRLDGPGALRFVRDDVAKLYGTPAGSRCGFAAFLPGQAGAAGRGADAWQVEARLRLGSGDSLRLIAPPRPTSAAAARSAVLAGIPPAAMTEAAVAALLDPAIRPLHAAHLGRRRAPDEIQFGLRPERPVVSIVIPLYRNLEFLRFQLSAFAVDPDLAGQSELLFVLDSPEQRAELEHFLRGLHGLYGLPMTLLVQGENYGYSAANNAAAAVARGRHLLFLNSDVIPDAPGWLSQLVRALEARKGLGAVGPKLLFDDDSIQHAGMLFERDVTGRWYNHHYFKGMPRDFGPANRARAVPAVTGACLLMPRELFAAVGGFCEDYVIGDFEDSDLCLRIRKAGYDIHYVPAVELYHLERQSISQHAGYMRGLAGLYNNWLHARRWARDMESLMALDWSAAPARRRTGRTP